MNVTIEKASGYINQLIDALGYLFMMGLSLILWWGIYSGVEITVASDQNRDLQGFDRSVPAEASSFVSDHRQASLRATAMQTETDS